MTANQIKKAKAKLLKMEEAKRLRIAKAYLCAVAILPAIIDDLEEIDQDFLPKELTDQIKKTVEMLIEQDDLFLQDNKTEIVQHQDFLKREFRTFLNEKFEPELKKHQ